MKVWIDIENSPHVLFFKPIIKRLAQRDVKFIITGRDKSETLELLKMNKIPYIGITEPFKYHGKNCLLKAIVTLLRAFELFIKFFNHRKSICVAINHGSRSHILAAYLLGIPVVAFNDYEHSNMSFYKRFVSKLFVPQCIPTRVLIEKGISIKRIVKYPGFKEELYVYSIFPNKRILERLGVGEDQIMVTLRPPAWNAHYCEDKGNVLFEKVVDLLGQKLDVTVVVLPRGREQYQILKKRLGRMVNFVILPKPIDSISLLHCSDIVIGGGGTMTREAAIIGTPAYSIFLGKRAAVDEELRNQGRLKFITTVSGLRDLRFVKRFRNDSGDHAYRNDVVEFVSKKLEEIIIRSDKLRSQVYIHSG